MLYRQLVPIPPRTEPRDIPPPNTEERTEAGSHNSKHVQISPFFRPHKVIPAPVSSRQGTRLGLVGSFQSILRGSRHAMTKRALCTKTTRFTVPTSSLLPLCTFSTGSCSLFPNSGQEMPPSPFALSKEIFQVAPSQVTNPNSLSSSNRNHQLGRGANSKPLNCESIFFN